MQICDQQVNEIKRNNVNGNRHIRNLEWNHFQWGEKVCCLGIKERGYFHYYMMSSSVCRFEMGMVENFTHYLKNIHSIQPL